MEETAGRIIDSLRKELKDNANEQTRISQERFFKEEVRLYGLKSATVTKIGEKHFRIIPDKSKQFVFNLCEELWRSGILEETSVACIWSYHLKKEYDPDDLILFEKWIIKYVTNWASCDTFCNHTIGTVIEMYPNEISRLISWTAHPSRWMRRASAVSLIVPAKKGLFLREIFEIADILLTDSDDMVQKGYGWMLKVASLPYLIEVFEYIMKNKAVMPRTSLRYAIEKMPADLKAAAMSK